MRQVETVYKTIQTVTGYKTNDNRVFENADVAKEHQDYLNYKEDFYNVLDEIFEDYLEEFNRDELPFNSRYLEETLNFIVSNTNLKDFISKLQELNIKHSKDK